MKAMLLREITSQGWTQTPQGGPIEIEVAGQQFQVELTTPVELQQLQIE